MEVSIAWLTAEQGGRKAPLSQDCIRYCPTMSFTDDPNSNTYSVVLCFKDSLCVATMSFLVAGLKPLHCRKGANFCLKEDRKIVATGYIV